jgi:hypothetical protein
MHVPAPPVFSGVESYNPATVAGLVYLEFTWGTALPPLSGRAYHMSAIFVSLFHPKLTGGSRQTHYLWQACLFKVQADAYPTPFLWSAQGALSFLLSVLFSSLFFIQFFFPPGRRSNCPGGYAGLSQGWLWGYHMPLICSPVGLHFPSRLGASASLHRSPPGFSI